MPVISMHCNGPPPQIDTVLSAGDDGHLRRVKQWAVSLISCWNLLNQLFAFFVQVVEVHFQICESLLHFRPNKKKTPRASTQHSFATSGTKSPAEATAPPPTVSPTAGNTGTHGSTTAGPSQEFL